MTERYQPAVNDQVQVLVEGNVLKVRRALGRTASGEPVAAVLRTADGTTVNLPVIGEGVTWRPHLTAPAPWRRGDVVRVRSVFIDSPHVLVRGLLVWSCSCGDEKSDLYIDRAYAEGELTVLVKGGEPVPVGRAAS